MKTDCDKLKIYLINTKDNSKITTKKLVLVKQQRKLNRIYTVIQSLQWMQKEGKRTQRTEGQTTR